MNNSIKELFGIKYPIVQAGMVWCSGWELASNVSNAGGLGVLGSGSMRPDQLINEIKKCQSNTNKPFAVNIPLLYPYANEHIETVIKYSVPIVFTSAGNPSKWTQKLKSNSIIVVHVVSSLKFALKAVSAGVDAIVCEGFEAGGHNGRNETTTLCLVPFLRKKIKIPIIAAGGISCGKSMLAVMILGADGVQIGTRFVLSKESTAHINFKNKVKSLVDGDTVLTLKEVTPVRMIRNAFFSQIEKAYERGESRKQLIKLLGKGRARKGMMLGDLDEGELEIGQVSALINSIKPAAEIINEIVCEFNNLMPLHFRL